MEPKIFNYWCEECDKRFTMSLLQDISWYEALQAKSLDFHIRFRPEPEFEKDKAYCPECLSPLIKRVRISKDFRRSCMFFDDKRMDAPVLSEEDDNPIKVRFDVRYKNLEKDGYTVPVADIRFQIWDERLRTVKRLGGQSEVPWCQMKHDNPAMIIRGQFAKENDYGQTEESRACLYFSQELWSTISDKYAHSDYYYGYEARRAYVEATDDRLSHLQELKPGSNRRYSKLRADHINCLANTLFEMKKSSFIDDDERLIY